jgi:hypothetical protein
MVSPRISPFTWGIILSASMAAFTKNDMNPMRMPYFFSKESLYSFRSAMTFDMSISLNVVSSAAVCFACTSRSAMRLRIGVIGTISSCRSPSGTAGAVPALGANTGDAGVTLGAMGVGTRATTPDF